MLITDLSSIVEQKNCISKIRTVDKWQTMEYQTSDFSGVLLTAGENTFPQAITLKLGLEGYHKIYLGFIHLAVGNDNHVTVRLTDDAVPSNLCPELNNKVVVDGYNYWASYQWMEEGFWKCADLTGQDLIIEKPNCITGGCTSTLAFIRVEKVEKEEKQVPVKNMMFHCDTDHLFWYYKHKTPEEYASVIDLLSGGNGEIVVQETYFEDFEVIANEGVEARLCRADYANRYTQYLKWQKPITQKLVEHAHSGGMKLYAGTRLEMGNFMQPLNTPILSKKFVVDHPEYGICTRDGRRTNILSYAFKEVRDWEINRLMKSIERGYDGISVFFIRGVFIGFEQPIIDRFKAWYGDEINPLQLPLKDRRINKVMCSFITEFFEGLRQKLDEYQSKHGTQKLGINIVVNFDVESNLLIGCDIEELIKKGLVDSVSQGLMKSYEDLTGCMDGDLIDLEKYKTELSKRATFCRFFQDKADVVLNGSKELLALTEKYNVDYYGALPWEGKNIEYFIELAQKHYALGVKKLISWNANHIAEILPKLNVVKNLSDREKTMGLPLVNRAHRTQFRVMSLDGNDISTFNTSWLG